MRVKDFERKKREYGEREEKNERGRGKHMNGFKRETLNESEWLRKKEEERDVEREDK
jgi:hypothetical protein